MSISKVCTALLVAVSLSTGVSLAQNVTSSVVGRIVDPANAVLASAPVTLTDQNTGNTRSANADSAGLFRFADIAPGTYSLAIQASGFKTLNEKDIVVSASETRDLGTLHLELGNVTDSISVTADVTPIQLASAEKSQTIDANQLNNVTLKGRDIFGYMKLIPGVIDTTASRDVTSPNAIGGTTPLRTDLRSRPRVIATTWRPTRSAVRPSSRSFSIATARSSFSFSRRNTPASS